MTGFPLPEVQWFSEGFPVHPLRQPYQQIYLVPTDSAHTATYTCVGDIYQYKSRELLSKVMVDVTVIVEDNSGNLIKLYYIATSTDQRQLALLLRMCIPKIIFQ